MLPHPCDSPSACPRKLDRHPIAMDDGSILVESHAPVLDIGKERKRRQEFYKYQFLQNCQNFPGKELILKQILAHHHLISPTSDRKRSFPTSHVRTCRQALAGSC